MNKKSFYFIVLLFISAVSLFAQAKLSKNPDAMLWTIEGTDDNGKPSKIYILGTIHIGDDRLYPLPSCIIDAWADSDRFVSEVSSEAWAKLQSSVNTKIMKSVANARKAKRKLKDELTEEEIETIESMDTYVEQIFIFEPWVVQQMVDGELLLSSNLKAEKSYDMYFTTIAGKAGIKLEGLDEINVQLDILSFGDWDFQMFMLKHSLEQYNNKKEYNENLNKLFECYLSHDEKIITDFFVTEGTAKEINENPQLEPYYEAMLKNRNIAWTEKFNDYLKKGGNTFIFAGTGHFIGEDSVFEIMRKNGYLF